MAQKALVATAENNRRTIFILESNRRCIAAYRPLMKSVAKIVARVADNLVKYMQLGDGTLGEVRGVRTIFENNRETIFIFENNRETIFIFENNR